MSELISFLPLVIVLLTGIMSLFLEVYLTKDKEATAYFSLGGISLSLLSVFYLWKKNEGPFNLSYFNEMFVIDNYSLFFYALFLGCAFITILSSVSYLKRENIEHGEFYALVLFAVTGMMLMVSGGDLIVLFLGIEIMSISVYVLAGFDRKNMKSNEAVLKYFFLGAFSSGFILYGIALVFGSTGSTNLFRINEFIALNSGNTTTLLLTGVLLLVVGFCFKVAAVPFHSWLPDAYEGSPLPVTGFMITAVKSASFALFLKVFLVAFVGLSGQWSKVIVVLSVITMFTGNIFALTQTNIKRMLAYSSVSHTGYLLIGLASVSPLVVFAADTVLFYLVSYSVASLGIFFCLSYLSNKGEKYINISDYTGIAHKYPLIGFTMTILLLSLIGIPPTGGFFAKYYLFSGALNEGLFSLVLIAVINSIISVFYYLRLIIVMYSQGEAAPVAEETGKFSTNFVLVYTSVMILWLGMGYFNLFHLFPGTTALIEWSKISIDSLF